jgi:hypothetical protein
MGRTIALQSYVGSGRVRFEMTSDLFSNIIAVCESCETDQDSNNAAFL